VSGVFHARHITIIFFCDRKTGQNRGQQWSFRLLG